MIVGVMTDVDWASSP